MVYLGLDLGEVTLGIARSDSGIIAYGVGTYRFEKDNYEQAANYIAKYIIDNSIDVIVLGYPKHMSSEIGPRAEISELFKNKIELKTNKKVVLWDERLTTKQATFTLKEAGLSQKKRSAKKDMLAAVIILQNYLDYKGEKENG
ncbi:MAG: Holliday junction resolvase RuvX [Acholeplasmataceae bacterium]|jgi:putative Holliday junction resolvase|nr:Holliday junction resolvase RuvX [Acholeplasmataceae bacterium]